jgi:hypothetical protein
LARLASWTDAEDIGTLARLIKQARADSPIEGGQPVRFLLQLGPFRFEVPLEVATLTREVAPDDTIARLDRARI